MVSYMAGGAGFLPSTVFLGGGNSNIFGMFTPNLGEMIQFEERIFRMDWFNHQLVFFSPIGAVENGPLNERKLILEIHQFSTEP